MELIESFFEHRELIIVGFFILQYAKLRMFELCYKFFHKFSDVKKFEELKIDTNSLHLAMTEEDSFECILPASEHIGVKREARTVETLLEQIRKQLFPVLAALNAKNMIRVNQDCSKRFYDAPKSCACAVKLLLLR